MKVINPKIIARITVELVEGDTKEVLQDMYRLMNQIWYVREQNQMLEWGTIKIPAIIKIN